MRKTCYLLLLLMFSGSAFSQTLVGPTMTGTPASGEYYNYTGITLTNFTFTATTGHDLYLHLLPGCTLLTTAVTSGRNYVLINTPRKEGMTDPLDLLNRDNCDLDQSVQYLDGLGRPVQSVQVKGSPQGNDVVQPLDYDVYGREAAKYLPYVSSTGSGNYKTDALTLGAGVFAFYYPGGSGVPSSSTPYAVTKFEPSPLNRVVEQGAPGLPWQPNSGDADLSHTVRMSYTINNTTALTDVANTLKVMLYKVAVATDGTRTLTNAGTTAYAVNRLTVTISKDENWQPGDLRAGTTQEFRDKEGHILVKRTFNKTPEGTIEMLSTYYVYDDFGNLCYVLPPGAGPDDGSVSTTQLNEFCYQYRYDGHGRMIEKKLPGKGKELFVYNDLDQLVMSQDAVQRGKGGQDWTVTKYDALGRVAVTGIFTDAGSLADADRRSVMQTNVDSDTDLWESRVTTGTGYTGVAYPGTLSTTLNLSYYDNYELPSLPSVYNQTSDTDMSRMTRGLLTGSRVKILDGTSGSSNMLWNVGYFDDRGRGIRSFGQHFKGGGASTSIYNYDDVTSTYDFGGSVLTSSRLHYRNNSGAASLVVTIDNRMKYDHSGRRTRTWEAINGTEVMLSEKRYNELGQLSEKNLHSIDQGLHFLQSIDYGYNIRGWLKNINNAALSNDGTLNDDSNDAFGMELKYEDHATTTLRQYNGNISGVTWQSKVGASGMTQIPQSYAYTYDRMNRLTLANYTTSGGLAGRYNEAVGYTAMGNIKTLDRYNGNAASPIDQLTYSYENSGVSNRLHGVSDGSGNPAGINGSSVYDYDANGNLLHDTGKGLTIAYNYLNLPSSVTSTGAPAGVVTYTYDASGRKLRKVVSTGETHDYINGLEYTTGGVLLLVQTEEGRALPNGSGNPYVYEYSLQDHLGNTRALIHQGGDVLQQPDYYAFGMEWSRAAMPLAPTPDNNYKYNGKELQSELSINLYDYGARFYDPQIARFTTIDAYAEQYVALAPYQYGALNPVKNIDVNGDSIKVSFNWTLNLSAIGLGTKVLTTLVYYKGGTAYNKNGTQYAGNSSFVGDVGNALNDLSKGAEGKALIDKLEASTNVTTIYERQNNKTDDIKGSYVFWNPNAVNGPPDQKSNTPTRPAYIGLGHELAHVEDIWQGARFSGKWFSGTDPNGNPFDVSNNEKYATYRENQFRAEQGIPLRTYYSPDDNGGVNTQSAIINGKGINLWIRTLQVLPPASRVNSVPTSTIPQRPLKP